MNRHVGKREEPPEAAKVRLTIELSQKLNSIVDKIATENETSKADVLRFAIEFLEAATKARKDGMQVGAWEDKPDGGRREREFVGI
jgi:predicted transcriptional regulator